MRSEELPPSYKTMCVSDNLTYGQLLLTNTIFQSHGLPERLCKQLGIDDDLSTCSLLKSVTRCVHFSFTYFVFSNLTLMDWMRFLISNSDIFWDEQSLTCNLLVITNWPCFCCSEVIQPHEKAGALRKQQSKTHALHRLVNVSYVIIVVFKTGVRRLQQQILAFIPLLSTAKFSLLATTWFYLLFSDDCQSVYYLLKMVIFYFLFSVIVTTWLTVYATCWLYLFFTYGDLLLLVVYLKQPASIYYLPTMTCLYLLFTALLTGGLLACYALALLFIAYCFHLQVTVLNYLLQPGDIYYLHPTS